MTIRSHRAVYSSIRRLNSAGIKTYVEKVDDNLMILVLDTNSILKVFCKRVKSMLTYKTNKVVFDPERQTIVVFFYRKPAEKFVLEKVKEIEDRGGKAW